MAVNQSRARDDDEIDFMQLGLIVWRGKLVILACVVVFLAGTVFYVREIAVPRFQASAGLMIEQRGPQVVDLQSVVTGTSTDRTAMNTELAILRTPALLESVVRQLDLHEDPEFNASLREEPSMSLSSLRERVRSLIFGPPPPAPEQTEEQAIAAAVGALNRAITTRAVDGTYIFNINVTSERRQAAVDIANALASLYIDAQLETKFEEVEYAVDWLSERVAELETELRSREEEIDALRSNVGVVTQEAQEGLRLRIRDIEERLSSTRTRLAEEEQELSRGQALLGSGDIGGLIDLYDDPALRRLVDSAADAPAEDSRVIARAERLVAESREAVQRQESQEASLVDALEDLRQTLETEGEALSRLNFLLREVEATRTLYDTFVNRLKETSLQIGLQRPDSRLVSPAGGARQIAPRSRQLYTIAIALGVLIGVGIVLGRQLLQRGFRSGAEMEAATGLPVMGQVPLVEIRKRRDIATYLHDKPTSATAEAMRNLRTSITLSNPDRPPQVIMTTSSLPGEGKTTVSVALGMNLADLGGRTLLLEGDIRRQTLAKYIDVQPKHAIIDVIMGDVPLKEAVHYDDAIGCDILLGQRARVNAADIFASDRFAEFMALARQSYDHIIIDTPPVLVVPDARLIARHCDAVVYLVKWNATERSQVADGLNELGMLGVNVTGLVLSQIDSKGMKRYGYGGRYGAYSNYGRGYYDS